MNREIHCTTQKLSDINFGESTPDIPGMIPETRSVTPGKPGVDTPVVYHKVETPEQKPEQPAQPEVTPVVNGPVQKYKRPSTLRSSLINKHSLMF